MSIVTNKISYSGGTLSGYSVVIGGSSSQIIGGYSRNYNEYSSGYSWIERALDYEKLKSAKKPFMNVKEWLVYKELEEKTEKKWNKNNNNSSNEDGRISSNLIYGD